MINLKIIVASTRAGRKGHIVGAWIADLAKADADLNVELIDLAEENLPFVDEPNHPRFGNYTQEHTKKWSAKIAAADAFIIVTPEYNHGFPATIKNAIDFLFREWQHKPVGFVSYGGISAGIRAVQLLKPVLAALDMMPIAASTYLPFFTQFIQDDKFVANESQTKMANGTLNELKKWSAVLKPVREAAAQK